ncbi:MAG: tRNA pseudouridine(38-40) synthase TruA [Pseudomonadota bacterium]
MPRYRLDIEYDGTPFYGWQRQDNFISIQQVLEEAIEEFTQEKVTAFAAGRTDTGVHALGQVVHVDLTKDWRPQKVQEATNGLLKYKGHPVTALAVSIVPDDFDARFSALKRRYQYRIKNRIAPLTVELNRAWWIRFPLDVEAMNVAAQELVGHHDFTTFRSTDCQAKSPMRTLDVLQVSRVSDHDIDVIAESRSFLHNQVRSIVGSLKLVGDGKWSLQDLTRARDALDRKACGPVAPACGLYLTEVEYPTG